MQRIQTPITGITTTSTYQEGSTCSLVNLRPKNGALHPVSPRKIEQELSQKYDIIFVHQNNDYKNWIGIIIGDYSSVYWDIRSDNPRNITSYIQGKINSVQQIGNTLSLITEDNIYYLFYQNGNYTFLGEMPQVPAIGLRTSDKMSHAKYYYINEYGAGTITPDNFIDATKGLVNKAMSALINGWTDKDGAFHQGDGLQLFDACFIRYAFRLYDGSITKHSPPILVMPVRNIVGKESEGNLDSIKTISYDFDAVLRDESRVDVYGYKIYMHYDFSGLSNWEDIIQSVDIFMSAPLGISNIENIRNDMPTTDSPRTLDYNLIKGISSEALKNVSNTSNFYFTKSIPLGKYATILNPEEFPSSESDISKLENLIYQEVMSDDSFSNHKYGSISSYAYNNRLHLANIKTTFFKGFNPDYFLWYNTSDTSDGNYNGYKYKDAPGELYASLIFEVEINTGITNEKVYCFLIDAAYFPIYKVFMSGFVSYPDPRAKRLTIYRYSETKWYKVFSQPLEKHNYLNLAFYITDGLNPLIENGVPVEIVLPDTSKKITLLEPNKIKVSELNNPLKFPNENTYQTSGGEILAMATNAMNVSDRNYGQFPLYIFTTKGIWTLNVGNGEAVYSTLTAPTYTEAPSTKIVGETPYGVVFTSQRGLMIINGQQTQFISSQIEQKPRSLVIEANSSCDGVVFSPEQRKFSEMLKNLSDLIYNPYENELIVNIKNEELNYVLNFDNQLFYQSTEKINLMVENVFPELLVMENNLLKNYSVSNTPAVHISLILRPLKFGMPDIKKFERMILRALLYGVTNPSENKFSLFMVHYSMDGVNFKALTGYPIKEGNIKDVDSRLMSRAKFSHCLYTLSGVVNEESEIYYLDTEFEKEYNNSKMR